MIKALIFLGIILIGLCISPWIVGNTGYVYIAAGDYQLETSLVFGIIMLIVFYALFQVLEWLVITVINLLLRSRFIPQHWRRRSAKKHSLTFPFKVHEVVAMGLYPLTLSQKEGQQLVTKWLTEVEIVHLAQRSYPTLSGGEKQRVQLARVLTQLSQSPFPPILLLDEPTSALDLAQQHKVLALAKNLAHKHAYTVIVVLHDLNQAARYSDRVIVLKHGEIVSEGSASKALSAEIIRQVWDYEPEFIPAPQGGYPLIF